MIPNQLRNNNFLFLLVAPNEKKPIEMEWQKKGLAAETQKPASNGNGI